MQLLMSNKFMEMNEQEMMEVDGGILSAIIFGAAAGGTLIKLYTAKKSAITVGAIIGGAANADRETNGGVRSGLREFFKPGSIECMYER